MQPACLRPLPGLKVMDTPTAAAAAQVDRDAETTQHSRAAAAMTASPSAARTENSRIYAPSSAVCSVGTAGGVSSAAGDLGGGSGPDGRERTAAAGQSWTRWILPSPLQLFNGSGGTSAAADRADSRGAPPVAPGSTNTDGHRRDGVPPPPLPPSSRLLLFCIPQAGMGAWVYHGWQRLLASAGVEVLAIELPGHNSRMREPPATDLLQLAENIAAVIRQVLSDRGGHMPYALFGHSMGAWIAYEVVQAMMRSHSTLPAHLFVSGCRAPHLYSASDDLDPTRLHTLGTAEQFWEAFGSRYGNTNPHLANPTVRKLVWPILRADFALVETYRLPPGNVPISVPTTVLAGEHDRRYTQQQVHAWSRHLVGPYRFVWLPEAGHDYVEKERDHPLLLTTLADMLQGNTDGARGG